MLACFLPFDKSFSYIFILSAHDNVNCIDRIEDKHKNAFASGQLFLAPAEEKNKDAEDHQDNTVVNSRRLQCDRMDTC